MEIFVGLPDFQIGVIEPSFNMEGKQPSSSDFWKRKDRGKATKSHRLYKKLA